MKKLVALVTIVALSGAILTPTANALGKPKPQQTVTWAWEDGTDKGQTTEEHCTLCWQVNIRTDGTDEGQPAQEHCPLCWQVNIRTDGIDEGQPKNTVPYVSR